MKTGLPDHMTGILWMVAATIFFTMTNVTSKLLGQSIDLAQIVWGRYFFHFLLLALILRARFPETLRTQHFTLQISRSILLLGGSSLYFGAFILMPLADAVALLNLAPVLVTLLAIPVLGEKVGIRRILGVATGFVGAVIIIQPGSGVFGWEALMPVGAAIAYAIYQIITRRVSADDSAMTSIAYTALAGAVLMTLAAPLFWQMPTPTEWLLLAGIGTTGAIGHYAMIRAYTVGEASFIAPFAYTILIWMIGAGYLVFEEIPDVWTWTGASLIAIGGIYVMRREAAVRSKSTATEPARGS